VIVKTVDERTRSKTSINELLRIDEGSTAAKACHLEAEGRGSMVISIDPSHVRDDTVS